MQALAKIRTPAYLRAGRPNVPIVYPNGCSFELGKANRLRDGKDLTIIANGLMVAPALEAAEKLADGGVLARVIDMHTVKPLDDAAVLAAARETGRRGVRRGPVGRSPVGGAKRHDGADASRGRHSVIAS